LSLKELFPCSDFKLKDPPVAELDWRYLELGVMKPDHWQDLIGSMSLLLSAISGRFLRFSFSRLLYLVLSFFWFRFNLLIYLNMRVISLFSLLAAVFPIYSSAISPLVVHHVQNVDVAGKRDFNVNEFAYVKGRAMEIGNFDLSEIFEENKVLVQL
jgi:phosphoglycerol transferase MdoB-like AlkP superfamily enzyme